MQAAMETGTKEVRELERSLQVQSSDLKALRHQLEEKDITVTPPRH